MRRGGDKVAVRNRIGVYAYGDQAGHVGDVGQQETADLAGNLGEARKIARYDDLVLVTGSLFVVGDARKILLRGAPVEQYAKN